jgi:hypothetical protein
MRPWSSSPASRSSTPKLIGAWLCLAPTWTRYARPGHSAMANAAAPASILGIVNVQWVCPTSSITSSASRAPKAAPRFAKQDGQSPRVLQENASRYSPRQDGHRTRAAPRS